MMRLWRARGPLSSVVLLGALAIIPLVMGCAGYAEPRGFLSVSPSSVSITTAVGTSNSQSVSVSNNSHATINVTQAQVTGTGFSAQSLTLPATIAPGQSLNITVKFTPTSSKSVDGMLMLMTDGQFRPVMARLHGSTGASSPTVGGVVISPATAAVTVGGKLQFTSTVEGSATDTNVTWSATGGSVSSSGAFTAPSGAGTVYVTATSVADPTKKGVAAVTVTATTKPTPTPTPDPIPVVSSIAISPTSTSVKTGSTLQFAASVQGSATDKSVTWRSFLGTINAAGVYTAPAKAGTDTVTATANADPSISARSTVSVTATTPAPTVSAISITPTSTSTKTGGSLQFTATVQGTATNKSVTWRAALGSINTAGVYTAPAKAGTDTVTATAAADPAVSASSNISVAASTPTPVVTSISVSPTSTSAKTGATLQFTASVQGTVTDTSVTWRAALGTINAAGVYTAPASAGTDTVQATSNADPSMSARATVSVSAATQPPTVTGVSVSPASASSTTGGSVAIQCQRSGHSY